VVGSLDTHHAIEVWNLDEELIHRWKDANLRVYGLALSPDGHRLVALLEQRIVVYDFISRDKIGEWTVDDAKMTSVTISKDSRHMLISMNPNKISLMVIDTGELVHTFEGHKQLTFMIRSSFGGASESFVVSGSEGMSSSPSLSTNRFGDSC
jgi:WD repeat-containing protein 26